MKRFYQNSVGVRLATIAFLTLIMLIPAFMVQNMIYERMSRRDIAVQEVSSKWGEAQTITGPVITIPYKKQLKNNRGEVFSETAYAHFLPDQLKINGNLRPEVRKRGIYEIILYQSELEISGSFSFPQINELNIPLDNIRLADASIALGISDMGGIKNSVSFKWNEAKLTANPGVESKDLIASGVSSRIQLDSENQKYTFSTKIKLNGSTSIRFLPVGMETEVKINSEWGDPSFAGDFLPESHNITDKGFSAEWKILHLNRNYPQQWVGSSYFIGESAFGVNLIMPVDQYQKNMRTAKYAIMFISLTFLAFFMIELLNKRLLHPIQYLLIGFALLVFYTLLLSFSEHISFTASYWVASFAIILLITGYTKAVLKNNLQTGVIFGILLLLYGYLFIVLQLQDFALLMGSIGLFVILATVMWLTRKIDWFNVIQIESVESKSEIVEKK